MSAVHDLDEEIESLRATIEVEDRPVRLGSPEEFVASGHVVLRPWNEDEEEETPVLGSISWSRIQYGAALEAHVPAEEVVDAHSQDLLNLHLSLFDSDGDIRDEVGEVAGIGMDVLVIDLVEVPEGPRFHERAAALVEHLVRYWAGGCPCAVYIEDPEMHPATKELLLDRGFRRFNGAACRFWIADLGAPRPPLPGEPPRSTQFPPGGLRQ